MIPTRLARLTPMRLATAGALLFAVSACGGAETKLRNGLVNAGLSPSMAACMATPMARDLSVNQLMKLNSLSKVGKLDPRRTSYEQLIRHIRALGDPEILRVTASAALGCAFSA